MNTFFSKLAMLVFFLGAASCIWAALFTAFPIPLINILLGILGIFLLLRALELADKINKLGPYAERDVDKAPPQQSEEDDSPNEQ